MLGAFTDPPHSLAHTHRHRQVSCRGPCRLGSATQIKQLACTYCPSQMPNGMEWNAQTLCQHADVAAQPACAARHRSGRAVPGPPDVTLSGLKRHALKAGPNTAAGTLGLPAARDTSTQQRHVYWNSTPINGGTATS